MMRSLFFLFFCLVYFVFSQETTLDNQQDDIFLSEDVKQIYEDQELIRQKSGKYLAISLGTSALRTQRLITNQKEESYVPILLGLKTGVQSFFTKNVGIRGFFAFDTYTKTATGKRENSTMAFFGFFSLGIDAIAEFPITKSQKNFLGGFFGIGFGGVVYTDNANYKGFKNMFISGGFIVETGIELTLAIKHRVAIGAKVTPIQKEISQSVVEQTDILPFISYQYKF